MRFTERAWHGPGFDKLMNGTDDIFDVAIHIRSQLRWVEARRHEDDPDSIAETIAFLSETNWLNITNEISFLLEDNHPNKGVVFIASEARRISTSLASAIATRLPFVSVAFVNASQFKGHVRRLDPMPPLLPYLEWWALAHSRFIIARRHRNLRIQMSTFSHTACAYGLNFSRVVLPSTLRSRLETNFVHGGGLE